LLYILPVELSGNLKTGETSVLHLNLRQKMIACFSLQLIFFIVIGLTFLKDFKIFQEDVTLLMHAGNLSNICLEIRRYEKNFIIGHNEEDFHTAGIMKELAIMPHPAHLSSLTSKLKEYRTSFESYRSNCTKDTNDIKCESRVTLRSLGQDIVQISEDLVEFEQDKMIAFISNFTTQLLRSVAFLIVLTSITMLLLYINIVRPLKSIEKAARQVAKGPFTLLPVRQKDDEVSSVLHAFNSMVSELKQQQEQLFQAKKLSSIGTLASGTAHQINNPLNNISTSCQLALSELEGGDCQFVGKMLATIEQETQRASGIVRGLLEFSRTQIFSMQPVLLDDVVKNVMRLVASEAPSGILVKKDIPDGLTLYLDMQKMVEALLNLLINAIHAIPNPPGTVSITASTDESSNQASIIIEDDGVGIDEENIQKIFDPFFTTKNVEDGTGLGLAVVYGIIKKHNGSIGVESVKGQGTRFIITLPYNPEDPQSHANIDTKDTRENNV
jgi:signal transduction histidine kinase